LCSTAHEFPRETESLILSTPARNKRYGIVASSELVGVQWSLRDYGSVTETALCGLHCCTLGSPECVCVARTLPCQRIVVVIVTSSSASHSLHARSETASPLLAVKVIDHGKFS
jgi:hypothetical protein